MVKDRLYCENQQKIVQEILLEAEKKVRIAVAWINFKDYIKTFTELLERKVKVKIAINNDVINRKYTKEIDYLIGLGAKIKFISMPNNRNYMHHKFCIIDNKVILTGSFNWTIDNKVILTGSFNWTKNANENNYESLLVLHDKILIEEHISEFKAVWQLSKSDLKLLRKPELCEVCGEVSVNICVVDQDGYYNTRADLYKICDCEMEIVSSEYFDIGLYNNLTGIFEKYNDIEEIAHQFGEDINSEELKESMGLEISEYLEGIRKNRMNLPIIYAVGIYCNRFYYGDEEERFISILWKEKYAGKYILDEYILD